MVAREDRVHERAVDGAPLAREELGQLLAPLHERGRALAGPDERVERQPRHAVRVPLREQRRAQRARRDAVRQEAPDAARAGDVVGRGREVVGAVGDVAVDVALLVGAAVAFHVDAPADEAAAREPVHHRRVGTAGHRRGRTSAATPSTSRARTARPACRRATRRTSPRGTGGRRPCASSVRRPSPARRRYLARSLHSLRVNGCPVRGVQSAFAPVSRTTFAHWSRSARKNAANSAGVEPTISMPELAM